MFNIAGIGFRAAATTAKRPGSGGLFGETWKERCKYAKETQR
jgi:hypothetical protein